MKKPPPPVPAHERLRSEIDQAVAEGHTLDALTLRLTLGDVSRIKRDPSVGLDDVSFRDGEMRYLGVRVVQGGVACSELDRGGGE